MQTDQFFLNNRFLSMLVVKKKIFPFILLTLSAICIAVDFLTGPLIQFPILFLIPIILASWFNGKIWGLSLSITLPLARMVFTEFGIAPWTSWDSGINTIIRISVFTFISLLVERNSRYQKQLSTKIKILEGFLPICSFCKKIRTKDNKWQQIEKYITEHSQAQFSHGLCPECVKIHYSDILDD